MDEELAAVTVPSGLEAGLRDEILVRSQVRASHPVQ
jgi:hypothetical protein